MSRIFCDISGWQPDAETWARLLDCIEATERARIGRFCRPVAGSPDRLTGHRNPQARLSLVGRLLLRRVALQCLATAPGIGRTLTRAEAADLWTRTAHGRPVLQSRWLSLLPAGLDANVSHADCAVVCVAEHMGSQCGVDVMDVALPPGARTESDLFAQLESTMTPDEWASIRASGAPLRAFYEHWTLKEAYVKAIGLGLGMELHRVTAAAGRASASPPAVCVDGAVCAGWHVGWHALGSRYVAAVVCGPPASAAAPAADVQRPFSTLPVAALVADSLAEPGT